MELCEVEGALEAVLFASGEPVRESRIAAVLGVEPSLIRDAAQHLQDGYAFAHRGVRIVRMEDSLQMCSAPEYADTVRTALETRKPPQLSQTALECLAIVAYYQPVTRVYIEQVRGVDSAYTVNLLQDRGLIEPCGRLAVPGRPVLYKTTNAFLRTFGISTLGELPELPENAEEKDGQLRLQSAIQALQTEEA